MFAISTLSQAEIWHDGCLTSITDNKAFADLPLNALKFPDLPDRQEFTLPEFGEGADQSLVVTQDLSEILLASLTGSHFGGIYEFDSPLNTDHLRDVVKSTGPTSLVMNLTSRTAFVRQMARHYSKFLLPRVTLTEQSEMDYAIVLQEAVANAILHGNLEVESASIPSGLSGLQDQYDLIEKRLSDDVLASRRVGLTARWTTEELVTEVVNKGPGYEPRPRNPEPANAPRRGMALIESLTERMVIDQNGRRITFKIKR